MRKAPPKGSRWLSQLRQVGPGAIVASTSIGAGETVLAVRAGAWGGYDLLWLILVATITKSFLTLYLLGRYAVVSGQSVAEKLIDFPGPRGWLLWLILGLEAVVAPFVFVVIAVPSGRLMTEILASAGLILSYKWFALAFVSLAILAGIFQRYETLEKFQTAICLVLLACTMLASILVQPEIGPIIKGFFRFGYFPDYPDWLPLEIKSRSRMLEMASVFGYAGSIAMNYVVYSNWVVIKGWTVGRLGPDRKRALKPLKLDVFFTASLILLVTVAFMIAGAAILAPLQKIPRGYDLLTEQAHIFAQISPLMIPLYYVIILAALWGSLNALPEIYGRGAHSFLQQLLPKGKDLRYSLVMKVFGFTLLVLTWIFIWTETTPIVMIDLVALFSTNIGVGLACIAAVWLDGQLPPEQRTAKPVRWAGIAAAAVISLMAAISAWAVMMRYL